MITINGLELTSGQLRYLLQRMFWKHTLNANLNTPDGCDQAATAAVDLLQMLDSEWNLTGAELPRWRKREQKSHGS